MNFDPQADQQIAGCDEPALNGLFVNEIKDRYFAIISLQETVLVELFAGLGV